MKNLSRLLTASIVMVAMGLLLVVTSCTARAGGKGPVVVASKIDTEGALLGSMIVLVLEKDGFKVTDKTQLGATGIVRKAILAGEIDLYPEYTGNAAFFHDEADSQVWKNAAAGWGRALELDAKLGLVWLDPSPANNTWAIAIRSDLAKSAGLKSMTDLGRYAASGGTLKVAGSEEFVNSAAALPSFQQAYGFTLRSDQLLVLSGGNTAATEKAAADGTNGVNAAMAYGTDGQLAAFSLVVLDDDKGVQPVYQPAPLIRKSILDAYPEIAKVLKPVFAKLDLVTLQTLNGRIAVDGQSARDVAKAWLVEQGFLK